MPALTAAIGSRAYRSRNAPRTAVPPVVAPMPTPAPIARPERSTGAVALAARERAAMYAASRRGAALLATFAGSTVTPDELMTRRLGALADLQLAPSATHAVREGDETAPGLVDRWSDNECPIPPTLPPLGGTASTPPH
jgi:hypothetical protein